MQTVNARLVSGGNRNGMESAGSVLTRISPEFVVSKQKLRQAEGSCIVRLKRTEGKQNLGFSSRPFVLCGLPVRKPSRNEMLYERRNGNFVLQITGHPKYGLPFGQDRIVPIYLATLAVRQKSQTIRFRTAAEMLETFGMHKGGKEYRRLVAAFERIFGATIFFGTDSLSGTARVVQRSRFSFFHEAQIWYSRDPQQYPICGSPIAAFWRKTKRQFRCLGPMPWLINSGRSNTPARAGFAKNSISGWNRSVCCGRNARRGSAVMERTSLSITLTPS